MRIELQPGKYRFATFAFQKKYEEALSQAGAKFHIEAPAAGESIEKLRARLDRNAGKVRKPGSSARYPLAGIEQRNGRGEGPSGYPPYHQSHQRHQAAHHQSASAGRASRHPRRRLQLSDNRCQRLHQLRQFPPPRRGVDIHPIQDLDHRVHRLRRVPYRSVPLTPP